MAQADSPNTTSRRGVLGLIAGTAALFTPAAYAAAPGRSAEKWRLRFAISQIDDEIGEVLELIADRQGALRRWEKRHPFPDRAPGESLVDAQAREAVWLPRRTAAIAQCRFGELHRRRDALFARRDEAVAAFRQAV